MLRNANCAKISHFLNQCKQFRRLSFNERLDFVTKSKLCWSCLEGDHFADKCSRINPCRKPSCTAKHTTLLHPPDSPPRLPEPKHADSNRSVKVVSSNGFIEVFEANQRNLLPIVPVKVTVPDSDKFVITDAFLNTGSTSSFMIN